MRMSDEDIVAWFLGSELPRVECTSTHCERSQECRSPSDCTGNAKEWNLHREEQVK